MQDAEKKSTTNYLNLATSFSLRSAILVYAISFKMRSFSARVTEKIELCVKFHNTHILQF